MYKECQVFTVGVFSLQNNDNNQKKSLGSLTGREAKCKERLEFRAGLSLLPKVRPEETLNSLLTWNNTKRSQRKTKETTMIKLNLQRR